MHEFGEGRRELRRGRRAVLPPPPRKHSMGDRDSSRRMSGSDGMGDKRGSDPLSALGRSLKNVLNKDRRKSQ